jgi:hypothetical protein
VAGIEENKHDDELDNTTAIETSIKGQVGNMVMKPIWRIF